MKFIAINKAIVSWTVIAALSIVAAAWYFAPSLSARDISGDEEENAVAGTTFNSIQLQNVGVMRLDESATSIMPQRYTATVVARRTSQLAFQASERVDEILVDEGDRVAAGQLLARQDQAAIKAQYDAAVARERQTAAVLAELEQGPREETIEAARAELLRLEAQANLSDVTLRRQSQLRTSRAISAQEYDASRFDREASTAAASSAQQQLDELLAGTRKEQIDAQKAALDVVIAVVAQAKARLDQTELSAPFAGQISQRFIDEGSLPQRGSPVLEIVETGHLELRFGVAPTIASELKIGQPLTCTANQNLIRGSIKQIQPKLDRSTRTQLIIVSVDENEGSLVDGQTVRIEFAIRSDVAGFWIPSESLQPQVRGLWSVLVAEPDDAEAASIAKRRDVEVLATWGSFSRVRGTLSATDLVIVEGSNRISSGQRVQTSLQPIELPWENGATVQLNTGAATRVEIVQ